MNFLNGATSLKKVNLANGIAVLTTTVIPLGSNSLTANYFGDGSNGTSVSAPIMQTVSPAVITMTLASTPNPSTAGKPVKFIATVTSNGGLPVGSAITFSYNGSTLGSANGSSAGTASFSTTTLQQGSNQVTATYAGSDDYDAASAVVTQVVNP